MFKIGFKNQKFYLFLENIRISGNILIEFLSCVALLLPREKSLWFTTVPTIPCCPTLGLHFSFLLPA